MPKAVVDHNVIFRSDMAAIDDSKSPSACSGEGIAGPLLRVGVGGSLIQRHVERVEFLYPSV